MRHSSAAKLVLLLAAAVVFNLRAADNSKTEALGALAGKLDYRLIPSVNALNDGSATSEQITAAVNVFNGPSSPPPTGTLLLDLDCPQITSALLQQISGTGVTILYVGTRWNSVAALGTISQVNALAALQGVRRIKISAGAANNAEGIAYNQVDKTIHADAVRNSTGLSGAGQKIGVISDSYNDGAAVGAGTQTPMGSYTLVTGTTPQLTGDIPAQLQVIDFGLGGGTDEGEALLESIHDIAPAARLVFASGSTSIAAYADNITRMRQLGCTITCDDLYHFDEPCFQDGPIAQTIAENHALGIPHFASAGNNANNGIVATYTPVVANAADNSLATPNGDDFHNWGLGGATPGFFPIDVPSGQSVTVALQWNQPYQSYALGPGSSSDLDFILYDAASTSANVLAAGGEAQFVNGAPSGDPFEMIDYTNNTGATQRVYLVVNHYSGSRSNCVFRVIFLNRWNGLIFPSGGVNGPTIFGHAGSAKSITVGAIFYADIESNGQFGPDTAVNAERYTSRGGIGANGIAYYFDAQGNLLPGAPVRVDKPDITAPDGGNTSLFGSDISLNIGGIVYDTDSFPNFFGTSAAVPNAAAVAALMLERASKTTPEGIRTVLQMTAHDIVSTQPLAGIGFDDITGAGWIDAAAAVGMLPGILDQPDDVTLDPGKIANFSIVASGSSGLVYQWLKNGTPIPGATAATLALPVVIADDNAQIQCAVANGFGTALSTIALVHINPPPKILVQPKSDTWVASGMPVFTIVATNGVLSYQWRRNGKDIPGAIYSAYTVLDPTADDNGAQFSCLVSNSAGSTLSDPATLTIILPPKITKEPQSLVVPLGASATFIIEATSPSEPASYQWFKNGVEIPGATKSTFTIPASKLADNALYSCNVFVLGSTVPSKFASLTTFGPPQLGSGIIVFPSNPIPLSDERIPTLTADFITAPGQTLTYSWFSVTDVFEPLVGNGPTIKTNMSLGWNSFSVEAIDQFSQKISASVDVLLFRSDDSGKPVLDPYRDNSTYADSLVELYHVTPVDFEAQLWIELNFAKDNKDSLTLMGSLRDPLAPGSRLKLDVVIGDGLGREFTLEPASKGFAAGDSLASCKVKDRKYKITISKSNLKDWFYLSRLENINVKDQPRSIYVSVYCNGKLYVTQAPVLYSAKQYRIGKARPAK